MRMKNILIFTAFLSVNTMPIGATWTSVAQEYTDIVKNYIFPSELEVKALSKILKNTVGNHTNKLELLSFCRNRTHEFLELLGSTNPENVPVVAMQLFDKSYERAAGYATGTSIVIKIENNPTPHILFACAHEAAHHVLEHPSSRRPSRGG
jgi:hypothetical protein